MANAWPICSSWSLMSKLVTFIWLLMSVQSTRYYTPYTGCHIKDHTRIRRIERNTHNFDWMILRDVVECWQLFFQLLQHLTTISLLIASPSSIPWFCVYTKYTATCSRECTLHKLLWTQQKSWKWSQICIHDLWIVQYIRIQHVLLMIHKIHTN